MLQGSTDEAQDCLNTINNGIRNVFTVDVKTEQYCNGDEDSETDTVLCIEVAEDISTDECVQLVVDAKGYLGSELSQSCRVSRRYSRQNIFV